MTLPDVPRHGLPPSPALRATRRRCLAWALAPWVGVPPAAAAAPAPVPTVPPAGASPASAPALRGDGTTTTTAVRTDRPLRSPSDWKTQVDLLAAQAPNTHAVLVEQRGQRLAETYFSGEDRPRAAMFSSDVSFDAKTLHDMRSISKSVVALLVGIARGRGLLGADDKPVLDWFPEHADLATPALRALRLEHLLSMSAGWAWDETSSSYASLGNSELRMNLSLDPVRHVLSREFVAPPGTRFTYCGGCTVLLAAILERATGAALLPWARQVLFDPLGLTGAEVEWMNHPLWHKAVPHAGLRLTPRGMLRLGRMLLQQGRAYPQTQEPATGAATGATIAATAGSAAPPGPGSGLQVVPADWVAALQQPRIAAIDGMRYGYHWWLGQVMRGPAQGTPWVAARGNGGQLLLLLPTLDAQIAITAGRYNQPLNGRPSMLLARALIESLRASG